MESLCYDNGFVEKKKHPFSISEGCLHYDIESGALVLPEELVSKRQKELRIRFIAHASILIEVDGLRIITDPWLLGPCFTTGWWHAFPPKADAIELLKSADLVYVSHNHPDHMHLETLSHLPRDVIIIVPAFESGSVIKPLKSAGFTNVHALGFNEIFAIEGSDVLLSILQAGDGRDDSGLYLNAGDFSLLSAVDSNALNNYLLPRDVNLLLSSFAGGASGFPLCFEMFGLEERLDILRRNRAAVMVQVQKYMEAVAPKAFMPYAGFFTEAAVRDRFIRENNVKNSPEDVIGLMRRNYPDVECVNPMVTDTVRYSGGKLELSNSPLPPLFDVTEAYTRKYIRQLQDSLPPFDLGVLAEYFWESGFRDDLVVYLVPTDDDFNPGAEGLLIDFRGEQVTAEVSSCESLLASYNLATEAVRTKLMKIRQDSLWAVVCNRLPWEDLSIGFQCRIDRKPNVYNSAFWFHFTNVYIGENS